MWVIVAYCGRMLSVFRGLNPINLDAKGRMAVPARYRPKIEEARGQMIVTIDTEDECLLLYPLPRWEEIEKQIQALPSFNKSARRIQRLLIGHATEVELDGSGRILLPAPLREYASMKKEIVLVGQGPKLEVWSKANWEAGRDEWINTESEDSVHLPPELQSLSL